MTHAAAPRAEFEWINRKHIFSNDWNPQTMTPAVEQATAESIMEFGFVVPILVHSKPRAGDPLAVEIVDGEHRWYISGQLWLVDNDDPDYPPKVIQRMLDPDALRKGVERAYPEVPIIRADHLDIQQLQRLTIVLNETKGSPDQAKLNALLSQLVEISGLDRVSKGLPWSPQQLEGMAKGGKEALEKLGKMGQADPGRGQQTHGTDDWTYITAALAPNVFENLKIVEDMMQPDLTENPDRRVVLGQIIEFLIAEYIGS